MVYLRNVHCTLYSVRCTLVGDYNKTRVVQLLVVQHTSLAGTDSCDGMVVVVVVVVVVWW